MKALIFISFLVTSSLGFSQVDSGFLSIETQKSFDLVPEFKFIKEEAAKMGIDVYLFGGSAAAFGHYVRWDVERQNGDDKYQEERFDYDFTNIYRGNQDLDLVVDGTAEQAAAFEQILMKAYPHFVGNKEAWEVRLLRAQIGDKLPLLKDPDFLNQHTDTNSTGLLALTAKPGEIVFRDLFDWDSQDSNFLKDVSSARIKFLFSDTHSETSRFKDDKNPPVFAAIRYLAKLAQYEVTEAKGDLEIIKKIISETNWAQIKRSFYVKHKLEEFGKKVLLNAPDSEYAWNLLDKSGLRKRLIEMDGNQINTIGTLSWWLSKEPLRSKPIGKGNGKTAKELLKNYMDENGDIVVSHETDSFIAYDNITRSSKGMANAFISREGISGEAALYGNGFYTQLGREGGRGTNLTIRFVLDPEAREGRDFIYDGGLIIVKNKNAMKLIQEDLNISMVDFLKLLASGEIGEEDKGLLEKFKRKFGRVSTDSEEFKEAVAFVKDLFFIGKDFPKKYKFNTSLIKPKNFEDLIGYIMNERRDYYSGDLIDLLKDSKFRWLPHWVQALIDKGTVGDEIAVHILNHPLWKDHPELVQSLIDKGTVGDEIAINILSQPHWQDHPELVQSLIDKSTDDTDIALFVLSQPHWKGHPEFVQTLIDRGSADYYIDYSVLSEPHWKYHPELLKYLNGKPVNIENIRERGEEVKFAEWTKIQLLSCIGVLR